MLFNSVNFTLFYTVTVVLYFLLPYRFRWGVLLGASYYFCLSWNPEYGVMLAGVTALNYILVRKIGSETDGNRKRIWLIATILISVAPLFLFKYLNFFNESLKKMLGLFDFSYNPVFYKWIIPAGISYYTFKMIGYAVDVYRGTCKPEKHFGKLALYISFFPAFTAGPIDRADKLIAQFGCKYDFDYNRVVSGLRLILWGFFKKIVIADRVAVAVNSIFGKPENYSGLELIAGTILFSIQLYADFSGYTDMAIGLGKIMGFRMAENFNAPYFAKNITEFWKKWHMSLTSWLMDYIFLPVAYSVSGKIRKNRLVGIKNETWAYVAGTTVTMVGCGLWHGAGISFVLWGAFHSLYMISAYLTKKKRKKLNKRVKGTVWQDIVKPFRVAFTFSMVSFLWIFFRADNVDTAFKIVGRIFGSGETGISKLVNIDGFDLWIWLGTLIIGVFVHIVSRKGERTGDVFMGKTLPVRWGIYYLLLFSILLFGFFGTEQPFIYFKF